MAQSRCQQDVERNLPLCVPQLALLLAGELRRSTRPRAESGEHGFQGRGAWPASGSGPLFGLRMLGPGDQVPDVAVWTAPGEEARPLRQVLGAGYALLCFYLWDWSPT